MFRNLMHYNAVSPQQKNVLHSVTLHGPIHLKNRDIQFRGPNIKSGAAKQTEKEAKPKP